MSWQAYVDTNLVGTGKVSKAMILGQQGGVWAATPGFALSPGPKPEESEERKILGLFNGQTNAMANGVTICGSKYFALQLNDRSFYGKKGGDGCVIVKTKKAILVTAHSAPTQMGESAPVVESLADYLISQDY